MRRAVIVLATVAAVACGALTACTATVGGAGQVGLPASAPTLPTLPSQPNQPNQPNQPSRPTLPSEPNQPAPTIDCPRVSDPQAGLTYRCVAPGIAQTSDLLWTLNLTKQVEPGWMLGEGSAAVTAPGNAPLDHVTQLVRDDMVGLGYWGPSPAVRTLSSTKATVAGVDAWVLASTFTIDSTFRSAQHLTVRTERTWIVALRAGDTQIALWYVTLPDDVQRLWPTVPALIKSIRLR